MLSGTAVGVSYLPLLLRTVPLFFLALVGCGWPGHISGTVLDFDTKQPIAGAAVSGSQDILLGLGPDYVTRAKTDRNGRFFLNYLRLDSSIYFGASSEGYSRFECWYHHDRDLIVRLKKRISPYTPLRQGAIHLRLTKDGKLYGWNFSERRMTASEDSADVLPTFIDSTTWGSLRVKAL
ncbi:MAG TPA: carboxypeptidase-like regulatory domain-containing protein, partial [Candidatus Limnocylindrales bacterium]|nr:carboxypeptidase-like regulatory domain-containing protein [Candidatus Limnocylindrales bacterium]